VASEWVGVVGTAIGAGIGSVVTVVSLFVKGKQEDRARADDRVWTVRLQNVEQRRELYATLLRSATDVEDALYSLLWPFGLPEEGHQERADRARTRLGQFQEIATDIDLAAVDRSVIEAAEEFRFVADRAIVRNPEYDDPADAMGPVDRAREQLGRLLQEVHPALRDACRRDLGFDSATPAPGP
jgi:hypothetical protein